MNPYSKHIKILEINPTELCNMKCSFCPRAHGYPNKNFHMTMETVKLIISQLDQIPQLEVINIVGRGEPTLHKNFGELIQEFLNYRDTYKSNLQIVTHTNGTKLKKYELQAKRLDSIRFSIYDETKESLDQLKNEYENWSNIVFLDRRTINRDKGSFTNRAGSVFTKETHTNSTFNSKYLKYRLICHMPFERIYVDWNGNYNLCCDDWADIQILGNIYTESLYDYINNNFELKKYQEMLLNGRREISPCISCNRGVDPFWMEKIGKKFISDRKNKRG